MDIKSKHASTGYPISYLLFISLLWGGNVISIKIGAAAISPLAMATFRFIISGAAILLYTFIQGISLKIRREETHVHLINGVLFAIQIAFFYLGTFQTSASHAALLINTHLFFVALLAHFFIKHDRLNVQKIIGFILALSGVWAIFYDRPQTSHQIATMRGNVLILMSALILAAKTIYIKRLIETLNPIKVVFWEMAFGVPLLGLCSRLFGEPLPIIIPPDLVAALLYQGVVVGGFCFTASTILLKRYPASNMASFSVLVPLFGVLLSHFVLAEVMTSHLLSGAGLIVIGIAVVNVGTWVPIERGSS